MLVAQTILGIYLVFWYVGLSSRKQGRRSMRLTVCQDSPLDKTSAQGVSGLDSAIQWAQWPPAAQYPGYLPAHPDSQRAEGSV